MTLFERCYSAILSLTPPGFRERYARDATELAVARLVATRGAWPRAARAVREIADAIRTVRIERRAARASRFSPPARSKGPMMAATFRDIAQDISYAFRLMTRAPGFTAAALLTIALAVGANTAMFSVVNGVLLRPLPYPDADRLVMVAERHEGVTTAMSGTAITDITLFAWAPSAETVEQIGAYAFRTYTVTGPEGAERVAGAWMSPEVLPLLRMPPSRGRWFDASEGARGGARVAIVGERFAERRFGTADVVGRSLTLDGTPHEIVGVMPQGFRFPRPDAVAILTPSQVAAPEPDSGGLSFFSAIARLAPGASAEQAAAEATAAARGIARPPVTNVVFGKGGPVEVTVAPMAARLTEKVRPALLVLTAGFMLLLVIACANVANLLLSRSLVREREIALRAALGAGRGRLLRQLLTEAMTLAAAGGLIGVGLGWALLRAVPALAPASFPRVEELGEAGLDWPALAVAAAAAIAAGCLSGIVPALRGARASLTSSMRDGDPRGSVGGSGSGARRMLLGLESALAVVLVVGALLLGSSFANLLAVDAGYERDGVLMASVYMPEEASDARLAEFATQALEGIRGLSGVTAAGAGSAAPFSGSLGMYGFRVPGLTGPDGEPRQVRALSSSITPGYVEALGMRVVEGRAPVASDTRTGVEPLLVNESFARTYLNDGKPVAGRRYTNMLGFDQVEIIGVVGDIRPTALDRDPEAQIYFVADDGFRSMSLVVRTVHDPSALIPAVRATIARLEPEAVIGDVGALSAKVALSVSEPRFSTTVLLLIASLAVLLAAVGLYGSLSYGVSRRRRELAIRAALGAERGRLIRLVVWEGVGTTAAGIAAGLAASAFLTRLLSSVLFGIAPRDPMSFAGAAALLLAVAVVASWLPARRAASVDPGDALRGA